MNDNLSQSGSSSHSVPGEEARSLLNLGLKIGARVEENALISSPLSLKKVGDYELLYELGKGGMGTVYKARQRSLNRIVALKMIRGAHLATESQRLRFHREAEMIAALDHPNIVHIHEFGEFEGMPYFSMEYIEGLTLQEWLADMPLYWKVSVSLVETVARTIDYAHRKGVLHRDLKPSNIIVDEQGVPRITDFGLACQIDVESGLTISGTMVGSPFYMAPEQARGATEKLGATTDVYSLGAMLYNMLAGRPPYLGKNFHEVMDRVLREEPIHPKKLNPDIPKELGNICLKALEKEPLHRYPTALDLAEDLQRIREGLVVRVRRVGYRKLKTGSKSILIGLLSLLGMAVTTFLVNRQMSAPTATAGSDKPVGDAIKKGGESKDSDAMPREISPEEYREIDMPALEAAEAYHTYLLILGARQIFYDEFFKLTGKDPIPLQPIDLSALRLPEKAKAYVMAYDKVYAPIYASNGHQINTKETLREIDLSSSLLTKVPNDPTVFTLAYRQMITQIPEVQQPFSECILSAASLAKAPGDGKLLGDHLTNVKNLFDVLISYAGEPMVTCLTYTRDMFIAEIQDKAAPAPPLKWPGFSPLKKEYAGKPYTEAKLNGKAMTPGPSGVCIPNATYFTWQIQVLLPYVEGKDITVLSTPVHFPYPQSFGTSWLLGDGTVDFLIRKVAFNDYMVKREGNKLTITSASGPNFYTPEFNVFMKTKLQSAHDEMDALKVKEGDVVSTDQAKWLVGKNLSVVGTVHSVIRGTGGNHIYLNFGGPFWNSSFRVQIPFSDVDKFQDLSGLEGLKGTKVVVDGKTGVIRNVNGKNTFMMGDGDNLYVLESLKGKRVSVRGEIKLVYGVPGMTILNPADLKVE